MKKIIIGAIVMAMSTTAMAKDKNQITVEAIATSEKPAAVQAKVDAIKASVKSKVEAKTEKTQTVRAGAGDMVLIHDGAKVIMVKELDPLEEMSVPATRTVFVGTAGKVNVEIKKLGLAEK
jgi:uncharacterized protein YdeI (BOF family)